MEFNCYDVLEVQGSRYIITEKIKYNEIIPKADQEQAYKAKPSMQKSPGDYWHEYGLEAVEGTDKIWVTIEYNDNEWCTVSRTSYRKRAPKGFTLHQIGLEKLGIRNINCPVKAALAYSLKKIGSKGKKCLPKALEYSW